MKNRILILGNPNVGKSILFNRLTGLYATVSNYPGTTVEIAAGQARLPCGLVEVVDTPGLYSLHAITEEERVTRRYLMTAPDGVILQVADARNLSRMLPLTLQLLQARFRVVLAVNMLDEAAREGLSLNLDVLSHRLGIPVVGTIATRGEGLDRLKEILFQVLLGQISYQKTYELRFSPEVQADLSAIATNLKAVYPLPPDCLSTLVLAGDEEILELVRQQESILRWRKIKAVITAANARYPCGVGYQLAIEVHAQAEQILKGICLRLASRTRHWQNRLSRFTTNPLTGLPILLAVLYFGLYRFVGRFGAGVLVDQLDILFKNILIPAGANLVATIIPSPLWQSLFVGEYGIISLGVRYAVAIILPIVGCFSFFFSLLEDSGYLPRLAMLTDRLCKSLGLNGRAIIPLTLGLGCDTMATLTTRILETRRERFIATFLLALAVPCSAQLGVILSLLSPYPGAVLLWGSVVLLVLLLAGHLLDRLLPGSPPLFFLEIPPLRLPRLSNILVKTFSRMQWYFLEVLPIFIGVSVFIWAGRFFGLFQALLRLLEPAVKALGLPPEAAVVFLFGFFRRDYGAAGLYDLAASGALSVRNLVTAATTLTLFLPCIAQFAVMWKERGPVASLLIAGIIILTAWAIGFAVNILLSLAGL